MTMLGTGEPAPSPVAWPHAVLNDPAPMTEETRGDIDLLAASAVQDRAGLWVNILDDVEPRRVFQHIDRRNLFEIAGGMSDPDPLATSLADLRDALKKLEDAGLAVLTIHDETRWCRASRRCRRRRKAAVQRGTGQRGPARPGSSVEIPDLLNEGSVDAEGVVDRRRALS
ncbi:hypothetical protein ACIBG7_11525 [Nonomuraea sp. NPDC050328]|uniref:hypothetical protein n=1 Tax=Nonomuraea sp. NPDC050328 TaxID=3364361 RepID=UPI0037B1E5FA